MRSLLGPVSCQTCAVKGPPKHYDELIIAFPFPAPISPSLLFLKPYTSLPLFFVPTLHFTPLSLSICRVSFFFLLSPLPLSIILIHLSRSLNPSLPPLQRVVLMCNVDPLYLTGSRRKKE